MTTKAATKHQIRVGIFITAGFIVTLFSMFMVGGDHFTRTYVTLHAEFEQVQGLNEGSIVSLQGIRIGNIRKFEFLPEKNKVDVHMRVDKAFLPRITEGSLVDIRTAGALGDKFIFINPVVPTNHAVDDGAVLEVVPASDVMSILSDKGKEASKVFDIISDIHKLTQALTAGDRIEKLMKNAADASESLKEASQESKLLISEIRGQNTKKLASAVEKMDSILTKIDNGQGTLGALINDPSLHESLKSIVGGSERKKTMKSLIRSSIEKSEN